MGNWMGKKKRKSKRIIFERESASQRMCVLGHLLYIVARYAFFSPPQKSIYSSAFWVRYDWICWWPETKGVNQTVWTGICNFWDPLSSSVKKTPPRLPGITFYFDLLGAIINARDLILFYILPCVFHYFLFQFAWGSYKC